MNKNDKSTNIIVVLGGPACGKSTICKKITDNFDIVHISVGELLMQEIDKNTELGQNIFEYINKAVIVPPKITFDLFIRELSKYNGKTVLVDGYPRNQENHTYFKSNIPSNVNLKQILFLDCDVDVMINRVINRNKNSTKVRFDDDIEIIKKRIHIFNTQTMQVIDEYATKGIMIRIDCSKTPDEIFESIKYLFIHS
ncbi:adenylate kinase/UMP-CMP kinase [Fadolivirus algeromassiliense]|jgi:adenylate kinase family enzyme|uniref:Adenylate kinase/UMP-CMP kinase n=1 Tax=Fadolivirus FV1/VV64 TaxID=3070911 RepID=A0A7D3V8Q4_9VIRU|nr:adenylate kinase/UMP-CMP kinase [Fadolivirus algeromassiliense]QKF93917.1 adenylate kinase/UMP-CMP kinase [Fadolivirus FV1/VV64]